MFIITPFIIIVNLLKLGFWQLTQSHLHQAILGLFFYILRHRRRRCVHCWLRKIVLLIFFLGISLFCFLSTPLSTSSPTFPFCIGILLILSVRIKAGFLGLILVYLLKVIVVDVISIAIFFLRDFIQLLGSWCTFKI